MYFPDLTPYEYGHDEPKTSVVNVGWLSIEQPFNKGRCTAEFLGKLASLVENPVNLYRGSHLCEFCPAPPVVLSKGGIPMLSPTQEITGNGEIRVRGEDGVIYVAPVLVLHYIKLHDYRPPEAFINAVLNARHTAT
jgi:hypothetical protein